MLSLESGTIVIDSGVDSRAIFATFAFPVALVFCIVSVAMQHANSMQESTAFHLHAQCGGFKGPD